MSKCFWGLCLCSDCVFWRAARFLGGKFCSSSQLSKSHFRWSQRKTDIFFPEKWEIASASTHYSTQWWLNIWQEDKKKEILRKVGPRKRTFYVRSLHWLVEKAAFEFSSDSVRVYKHYIAIIFLNTFFVVLQQQNHCTARVFCRASVRGLSVHFVVLLSAKELQSHRLLNTPAPFSSARCEKQMSLTNCCTPRRSASASTVSHFFVSPFTWHDRRVSA